MIVMTKMTIIIIFMIKKMTIFIMVALVLTEKIKNIKKSKREGVRRILVIEANFDLIIVTITIIFSCF